MERVFSVQKEYQTSHNILLSQNLIQSKALTPFNPMELKGESFTRKCGTSRVLFMRFKERSRVHNIAVQVEAANADVEAAASCPEIEDNS